MIKTVEEIREFCKGHYYCDNEKGEWGKGLVWQPFENKREEEIEEYIENDTMSMCKFLDIPIN